MHLSQSLLFKLKVLPRTYNRLPIKCISQQVAFQGSPAFSPPPPLLFFQTCVQTDERAGQRVQYFSATAEMPEKGMGKGPLPNGRSHAFIFVYILKSMDCCLSNFMESKVGWHPDAPLPFLPSHSSSYSFQASLHPWEHIC